MSRFFSDKFTNLEAYVPGEQPKDQQYIKLNTNENAFPPHPAVAEAAGQAAGRLQLYPDPECMELRKTLADRLGLTPEELIMVNGSDDILNFAFMAFCDRHIPAVFPDITYGFSTTCSTGVCSFGSGSWIGSFGAQLVCSAWKQAPST